MASLISNAGIVRRAGTLPWRLPPLVVATVLALRLGSDATANVSYFVLAAYALTGRAAAIQALALSWLITMFNPGIAPEAEVAIGRYVVLLAAVVSVASRSHFFQRGRLRIRFAAVTIFIGIVIVIHGLLVSPYSDVSIGKALSWMLTLTALLSAWSGLTVEQSDALERWFLNFFIAIAVISSLFLFVPQIGYLRNGSGFQGILNQPQAFGVMMALFSALLAGRLLENRKHMKRDLALFFLAVTFVIFSEARTAGLAFILGMTLAVAYILVFKTKRIRKIIPALTGARLVVFLFLSILVAIIFSSQLSALVDHFITKSGRANVDGLWEAYQASRAVLFDPMLANISANPMTGIGFGIASDPDFMTVMREPIFGLPLSAPIEKGVVPLMVLEELGIPGFALFVFWILALVQRAARRGLATLGVLLTALLINMGEGVLFSPGGMGMLILILLSWAVAKPLAPTSIGNRC